MYWCRAFASSIVTALYSDARMPPTERCPFSCCIPSDSAPFRKSFSSSSLPVGPPTRNGTFIRLRTRASIGQ
uniref:Putative secreted protein n=1 Tax=Anopheles darlingi TaxID=43151 RepID=A0A2M4D898_ANODA